jgi:hypothetical protein
MSALASRMTRFGALVAGCAALILGAVPAGAQAVPGPVIGGAATLYRGQPLAIWAYGLTPAASYSYTADGGAVFEANGQPSITVTTYADGSAPGVLVDGGAVPAGVQSINLTLLDSDNAPVAGKAVTVGPAVAQVPLCPAASGTVMGYGFADGDYTLSSPQVTFQPALVHASGGHLQHVTATADSQLPASYVITATAADNSVAGSSSSTRLAPQEVPDASHTTPWHQGDSFNCFAPGETVRLVVHDTYVSAPDVVADSHGVVHVPVALHPHAAPHVSRPAGLLGLASQQTAVVPSIPVSGTTLTVGQSLQSIPDGRFLVSPTPDWYFANDGCDTNIGEIFADGGGHIDNWQARYGAPYTNDLCSLRMQSDGNLALHSPTGKTLWTSRTYGTGQHNRLVMRSGGTAAIYTADGTRVWATNTGVVTPPRSATLPAGRELLRGQSLTRNRWKLQLRTNGDLVLTRAGVVKWHTRTAGRGVTHLVLQRDGNLVLRRANGTGVWATHTRATGRYNRLVIQDEGDLVLYTATWRPLWSTGT